MAKQKSAPTVSSAAIFALPSRLSIEAADAVAGELQTHIENCAGAVTLDASGIEALTTPGIQLLMATMKTLGTQNRSLSITHTPEHVLSILRSMGMPELLTSNHPSGA